MYDYFTHKWNEDKVKYDEDDIIVINGFDINDYGLTNNEIENMKRETIGIIRETKIKEYAELYDYLDYVNRKDLCEIVSKNVIFFNSYLKSKKGIESEKERVFTSKTTKK